MSTVAARFFARLHQNRFFLITAAGSAVTVGVCLLDGTTGDLPIPSLNQRHRTPVLHAATTKFSQQTTGDGTKSRRQQMNFVADVVEMVSPSVVNIEASTRVPLPFGLGGQVSSGGSGLIVRKDGLVLTNAHVVSQFVNTDACQVLVTLSDGRKMKGRVVKVDHTTDLAAVKLEDVTDDLPALWFADSAQVRPGEFVAALGSPFTLSNSVSIGVVSNPCRSLHELGVSAPIQYLQTDAAINVGNSGGPLVNMDGEVVGISAMKLADGDGVSFAIPASHAKQFIADISWDKVKSSQRAGPVANTLQRRRHLGISYYSLDKDTVRELKRLHPWYEKIKNGAFVHGVTIGSPAHLAGVEPGDVITRINGQEISGPNQVRDAVADLTNDSIELTINRQGETVKLFLQFDDGGQNTSASSPTVRRWRFGW